MPFLNLDLDYENHPKTQRLVGLLGSGAEILPIRLWCYAGKYQAKDGKFTDYGKKEIESVLRWWGQSGKAVDALVKCGFLKEIKAGYQIHDWKSHQGHIHMLKMRNKKVAVNRWERIKKEEVSVDTSGIPMVTTRIPQSNPFLSKPNLKSKPLTLMSGTKLQRDGPETEGEAFVLERLVDAFKSPQNRGFYLNAIRSVGERVIEECARETVQREKEGKGIQNPAAYFAALINERIREAQCPA